MMQEEIKNCIENCSHAKHDIAFIPTRLIDLKEPQTPRLARLGDHTSHDYLECMDSEYAALSYCWGSALDASLMLKTEKGSLKSRFAGIAIDEMPLVFQDAIAVCHKLSIRYLWIDALCIVQDDNEDWEREAPLMGKIYEDAYVTIVPLAAQTSHESFLQRSQITVEIDYQSIIRPDIYGKFRLRHFTFPVVETDWYFSDLDMWEIRNSRWHQRGWTFQENELSARVLYFGQTTTIFRCHNWMHLGGDGSRYLQQEDYYGKETLLSDLPADYRRWETVTSLFSDRCLSYPKDKFPAISALAQRVGEAKKDDYVAGLWRKDLFRGLLWNLSPKDTWENFLESLNTPNPYVAPSWSWASSKSYVEFCLPKFTERLTQECKIIDIRIDVPGCDPYGVVASAILTLSGKLAPLSSVRYFQPSKYILPSWEILKGSALLGIANLDWITNEDDDQMLCSVGLRMLLIASWGKGSHKPSNGRGKCAYGLILLPTGNENEYRRVGVFSFGKGGKFADDSPWNNRLFRGQKALTINLV